MTAAADAPAYRLTVSVPPGALREALGPLPDDVELLEWDLDGPAARPHIDLVVRPGALLVNVTPGAVVDTDALVAETSTGRRDPRCDPQDRRLVRAQVDRMLAGEPPLNVVVRS